MVAYVFGLKKSTLCDDMKLIREQLKTTFVRSNLGFRSITRERAREHQTHISRVLFPAHSEGALQSEMVLTSTLRKVATMSPRGKPSQLRRRDHSITRWLVYFLMATFLILFPASQLDRMTPESCEVSLNIAQVSEFFREDDCSILDRGFRDVARSLREDGCEVRHPSFAQRTANSPSGPL